MVDDFCKEFVLQQEKYMIEDKKIRHRNKPNRMSDAEIMVILILFHSGDFRCFKHYYKEYVCKHLKHLFPRQVSYNRFVELEKEVLLPMTIFIKKVLQGTCTGISFVDSTPLRVCRNQRILIHKTFEGLAERGKCSMGWFFGFKLHLIINDKGEILNFMFTPGNVDDREPLKQGTFLENIKGKLCADKGYIGQALFENLFLNGIQLVTKVKNNSMKNSLMSIADKILLRKRALIETVNNELKNIAQIEHSRHRSFSNFIANSLQLSQHTAFLKRSPPLMSSCSMTGNCLFSNFISNSRYRNLFEHETFDWFAFNDSIISKHLTGKRKAIAIDPSYIPKSGKKTPWSIRTQIFRSKENGMIS